MRCWLRRSIDLRFECPSPICSIESDNAVCPPGYRLVLFSARAECGLAVRLGCGASARLQCQRIHAPAQPLFPGPRNELQGV